MEENVIGWISAASALSKLNNKINEGKSIKIYEKFPEMKTDLTDCKLWWNSLNVEERSKVGWVAFHFGKQTANSRWQIKDFELLSNRYKSKVRFCFKMRNSEYLPFDLVAMMGLY
jgi:hypothetical protein